MPRTAQIKNRARRPRKAKGKPGVFGLGRRLLWSWWLWLAVALLAGSIGNMGWGVVAGVVAVFCYLITPQEESPRYGLDVEFAVESHEFIGSLTGTTGVPFLNNNALTVLHNGDRFYPAMLEAIGSARRSITIEAFIYWEGRIGRRFAEALVERSRSGVPVKILLDAVGSSKIGSEILGILEAGHCEVAWYNPVRWRTIGRFNNRTHRKSLIVDGRIAFTGGAGIADHWTGNAQDREHWRDTQVRLEGPAAMGLQSGFAHNWLDTTGELVSGQAYFPPPDAAGRLSVQTLLSSPESGSSSVRIMYYLAIVAARKRILIANPYFIPDKAAVEILVDAAKRGVDVQIMVAGKDNDMAISRYGSMQLYGDLIRRRIRIYEYDRTMMHQKIMIVDGVWCTIGTTNFDNRSFALNEESNVCVHDRLLATELESTFAQDLQMCHQVTLAEWRNRGIKARVFGAAALLLKEQI